MLNVEDGPTKYRGLRLCSVSSNKYLVTFMYIFRFISNLIDIIAIAVFRYSVDETSKCSL